MIPQLLLLAALLSGDAFSASPPTAQGVTSSVKDQGAVRPLNLVLGESVVIRMDAAFKPVLISASRADANATSARLSAPIDLQTPETSVGITVTDKDGDDPKRLNRAAPGTIIMTLVPYQTGTILLVENGLDTAFRYHAATMQPIPGGGARGSSTTLCPAKPGIGTVETWAARFASLLVIKFEPSAPGDANCRM